MPGIRPSTSLSRRSLLASSGLAFATHFFPYALAAQPPADETQLIKVDHNENAWGPSPLVRPAIEREFSRLSRYAETSAADSFAEQIAAHEKVPVDQVILGEVLGALGLIFGSNGGPGGEFIYSIPGYLALIDSAAHVGGIGVPVPLNTKFENDLPALQEKLNSKTRAYYLVNPHNPTGTVSDPAAFHRFLKEVSEHAPVIVDEAYLEFTPDFASRTSATITRDGGNVLVFRTFDKIHGLAGLPIGYTLAPRKIAATLRAQGLGDAESLGRLNIAAASAALSDTQHVARIREAVAVERNKWIARLDSLHLQHTHSSANFVYFNAKRPQEELASQLRKQGVEIGRPFPPYENWARITIGLPEQNEKVWQALQAALT